jgi:sec-independent protein translocase protein TatA
LGLGLGPFELILIFAVLLLLFGAKRLPELAGGMGKGIRDFKRSLHGIDEPLLPPPPDSSAADPR